MRVVQRYLTHEEWDRVGEQYFVAPLTRAQLLRLAAWVLHDLPAEAVTRIRAERHGLVLVALWRLALRRPFARRERAAFRYA
jgi:hypothetical protein